MRLFKPRLDRDLRRIVERDEMMVALREIYYDQYAQKVDRNYGELAEGNDGNENAETTGNENAETTGIF